ncbi:MAG: glycerophosphodiester phosphodiesterase [Bdellovibrionales bacterium]|nr:glycerophosphodiester phosphodiesterase [Bdellovibrionales bacterium]
MLPAVIAELWMFSEPHPTDLEKVKIVAHRGAHKSSEGILENTLPAFDRALDNGVWGVEFDIRWTKDNVPVVHHDASTGRLFFEDIILSEVSFKELRSRVPEIPTLHEVVQAYGKRMHLMIEIKEPLNEIHERILSSHLEALSPVEDFHILSLHEDLLRGIRFVPYETFILVSTWGLGKISTQALKQSYGGIAGYYGFFTKSLMTMHIQAGQGIGVGQVRSKRIFHREIRRGADWIFTNHAVQLKEYLDRLRQTRNKCLKFFVFK